MSLHIANMDTTTFETICKNIYNSLGNSHSECIYQKALSIELYNHGATSVESEKYVPVFFVDSNERTHTIGMERIDLLARFDEDIFLIELKAHASGIRENVEIRQLRKYVESLSRLHLVPKHSVIVNFPQNCKSTEVEFHWNTD